MILLDPLYYIEGRHMKPLLGSIISAGASLLGGALANKGAKDNVSSANAFTTEQMQNRHQWEVDDLRKAGLNPILSAGGTPSMGGSPVAQVQDIVGPAVNSALASKRLVAEIDKMKSDTTLNDKLASQSAAQENLIKANQVTAKFDAERSRLAGLREGQAAYGEYLDNFGRKNEANFNKDLGEARPGVRYGVGALRALLSMGHSAKALTGR